MAADSDKDLVCRDPPACVDTGDAPVVYALGPLGRWARAREVAEQWERRHGSCTTAVHEKLSHLTGGMSRT